MDNPYAAAPEWITDEAALAAWCAAVPAGAELAIDTEFERQRTYYAELCVVQLAAAGRIACVDMLALGASPALAALFARRDLRKLAHAARQDLEVLAQTGALPTPPFHDTQIAAALVGFDEQIGYAELLRAELDVEIDKSQTRTDWRQRPLSAAQLAYAADDVRYLPALAARLDARLAALGRSGWFEEDCREALRAASTSPPPAAAWQRVKGLAGLPAAAFARGAALAAWRETQAQAANLPRGWVLKDAELVAIAAAGAGDRAALAALLPDNPAFVRRHGASVCALLAAPPEPAGAPPGAAPSPAERARGKACAARLRARAEALGVQPAILMTRREIEALVRGERPQRLVDGWRAEVLADVVAACAEDAQR